MINAKMPFSFIPFGLPIGDYLNLRVAPTGQSACLAFCYKYKQIASTGHY
jgi:hypothetical protein